MRKFIFLVSIVMAVGCSVSCGNKLEETEKQRDSIAMENQYLNDFLDIVAFSLDSINGQESSLYMGKDGKPLTNKEQIRDNIQRFKYNLEEQQKRIAELEKQLDEAKNDKATIQKLRGMIKSLQSQLEEKNKQIEELQAELEQKNFDIANLQTHVESLSGRITELTTQAEETAASLETAENELNEMSVAYVIMGTKSELTAAGVLKGGFLKKKKVNNDNLDTSNFRTIDTRNVSQFYIPGHDAKLLSSQPSSSYTITDNGNSSQLIIQNPSQFWGASHYVIIQYK